MVPCLYAQKNAMRWRSRRSGGEDEYTRTTNLWRHLGNLEQEEFFQLLCHDSDIIALLVVDIAVCKHCVEILHTVLSRPVLARLQLLFYCAKVHWMLDNLVVILKMTPPCFNALHSMAHLHISNPNLLPLITP